MLEVFKSHIEQKFPYLEGAKLLVAISGGVDSIVLAYLCKELGLSLSLAHCNFNLRGNESDIDEDFVLQLAKDWELEVFIENFDTKQFAVDNKLSTQMAARALRYMWFNELKTQLKFDYILTAHHANDDFETFLINLSRGTGLDGLLGIPQINEAIVRPLLPFTREEIEKFARDKKVEIDTLKIREEYRRDFLGNVSHELKTPLFTVQGYILTLLDGAIKDKKVSEKYLKRASKGVERLIYIVKDLDMITKLETGDLNLVKESFDIIDVIKNVFELLEMRAAKKEITLTFDMEYPDMQTPEFQRLGEGTSPYLCLPRLGFDRIRKSSSSSGELAPSLLFNPIG